MTNIFLQGPIPAFNNPPIEPQFYTPKRFVITDVTLGQTTIVTTQLPHDYVIGQLVRILIPYLFGCRQLNETKGYVISIPSSTQVEVAIDSSINVDPFISSSAPTKPEILAIGDINSGVTNLGRTDNRTYIPGSFRNISPQ